MKANDVLNTFYPKSKKEWRDWLQKNHLVENSIWLIKYKQKSGKPTISWSEAVDEALCFGWIDSTIKKLDEERTIQFFTKRKAKSTWSKINKQKVSFLIEQGLMSQAGLNSIEIAKENGSWTILDSVEELEIPNDLELELKLNPKADAFFQSISKSVKKSILYWIVAAKRQETRQKRIKEIITLSEKNQKPKQF